MATRRDVADRAHVSPSTVTRALNDHPSISRATAERVQRIARELDYIPSRVGRGHYQRKSFQLGLVIPFFERDGRLDSVAEEYFSRCLFGMATAARKSDFSISIVTDSGLDTDDLVQEVRSRRVDGLIFLGSTVGDRRFGELFDRSIPLVLVHNRDPNTEIPFVDTDSSSGLGELFALMQARSISEIGVLNGGKRFYNAIERKRVIERYAEQRGIRIGTSCVGNFSRSGGRAAAQEFIRAGLPELIVCTNDRMAFGLAEGLRSRGVVVGRDVQLTGFDDLQLSTLVSPALTTIHNPFYRVGHSAVEILLSTIEDRATESVTYPTHLVVRESFR